VLEEVVGGPGRVVGIVGEPGIGKTRLLYEVKRSLIGKDLVWREGRCAPHGAGVPYLPVLDLLRDYCGIAEFDSTDVVLAAVNRALETARLDPLEGVPYLVRLLGMDVGSERCAGFTPDMVRAQAIEVLCELLIRSSHDRPLVVCVEDLQWIDRPSEEFLTSLVERLPGAPLLLIASYRPGYRPPWLGKSYAMQVTLAGLSMADSLKIIEGARTGSEGPLEGAVAEAIATRADGNPFFLEELARGLGTGGSTAVPTVPATIQDVLMERIVRVPEGPRRCLQVASVLGRSFALDHLEEIGDRPAEVAAHLNELRRLEFVHESHTGSGRTYRFKHALTQEVAYASLPPAERERLHGAAGRVLEQSCAGRLDEVAHQLAYHFTRSALSDKAVESLVRFAERAARCYAHAEAAAALQQALEYVRRWDDVTAQRRLAEIVLALGGSLYFLGRFRDIRDLLSRHRADVVARRDARLLGRYYFRLAHTADLLGDHAEAIDSAQRAVREAECAGDVTTRGQAHYVLTRQGFWAGDLDKANEHGREAIACLQTTPERWWLGMAHWAVGVNYTVLGKLPPALAAFAQAEAVGVEIRDQRLRSYAAFGTGWAHAAAGRGLAAIEACQRGVEHAPDPVNRNYASAFLGLAHLVNGDAPQAIALLEPVVRELARFEFRQPQGWHSAMLAEAYLATGTVDRARVTALEGLRLTTETGYRHGMGWARRVLGRIETASEKLEEAASHLQIALELFNSIHAQIDVAQTRIDLAALAWRSGHSIQARAQLAQALKLWRALGVPRWIERSECLAAEWDRGCPESEAAFPTPQQPG
jgi:tetratricopeptide (TPR) repeat protein